MLMRVVNIGQLKVQTARSVHLTECILMRVVNI
jgi:hypothetical protein